MIVLQISFVLQLHFSPYYNTREDRLETLSLGATTVSLVLGQGLLLGGRLRSLGPGALGTVPGILRWGGVQAHIFWCIRGGGDPGVS